MGNLPEIFFVLSNIWMLCSKIKYKNNNGHTGVDEDILVTICGMIKEGQVLSNPDLSLLQHQRFQSPVYAQCLNVTQSNNCRSSTILHKRCTTDWMFVSSPTNSYIKILTPNVRVLGDEAFGRLLAHEGRDLISEISILIRDLESSLAPFPMWRYRKKMVNYKPRSWPSPYTKSVIIGSWISQPPKP